MRVLLKPIIILLSCTLFIFLFIMLYRVSIGKDAFFGFYDFVQFVKTLNFDEIWQDLYSWYTDLTKSFASATASFENDDFWQGLANSLVGIFEAISLPIVAIYDVIKFIGFFFSTFHDFIVFISA